MPDWQPNRDPVRWNYGAADDAVSALRRAADILEQSVAERERLAVDAMAEWRGPKRVEFEEQLRRLLQQARDLAEQYREVAVRIERASERAREEERRRRDEIMRWEEELAIEAITKGLSGL